MVTQRDLAEHLGVSQQTVSFALTGRPGLKEETRQRVLEAAAELGYRANAAARDLRGNRRRQVGVLIQSNAAIHGLPPVGWEIVDGLDQVLGEAGYRSTLIRFTQAISKPEELLAAVAEDAFAGMVVVALDHAFRDRFDANFPGAVHVDDTRRSPRFAVWRDEEAAGRIAAEVLIAAGYRRLLWCHRGWQPGAWARERRAGAEAACRSVGADLIDVDLEPRVQQPRAFDRALDPGDALCVAEEGLALRLRDQLLARGVIAGRDLAIACADDSEMVRRAWPGLTRAGFDRRGLGRAAGALLLDQIEHPERVPASRVLDSELITGATIPRIEGEGGP